MFMGARNPKAGAVAGLVKKLIEAIGMTQEGVADKATELGVQKFTRNDVNKVCGGKNLASTDKIRHGLSMGLGVHRMDLNEYLDGKLSLDDMLRRRMKHLHTTEPKSTMLPFGQLEGWPEAETEARDLAASVGSELVPLDFVGARMMPAFGIPTKITARFVATVAWIWKQTATAQMRQAAERAMAPQPKNSPSGSHRAAAR